MSAPLPCCSRIKPIMPSAVSICTASTTVNNTFIESLQFLVLRGRGHDLQEVRGLQGCATHQAAVDVGLGQKAGGIGGIHAAAVKDMDTLRMRSGGAQLLSQEGVDLLGLVRR